MVAPVRYPVKGILRIMERAMRGDLRTIQYVHDNTYRLVLWIWYYLLHSVSLVVRTIVILIGFLFFLDLFLGHHPTSPSLTALFSLFAGGMLGRLAKLKHTLSYLFNYENSVAFLEQALPKGDPQKNLS